jgi:hypothetical protein
MLALALVLLMAAVISDGGDGVGNIFGIVQMVASRDKGILSIGDNSGDADGGDGGNCDDTIHDDVIDVVENRCNITFIWNESLIQMQVLVDVLEGGSVTTYSVPPNNVLENVAARSQRAHSVLSRN